MTFGNIDEISSTKVWQIKNDSMALYMKKIMGIQNVYTIQTHRDKLAGKLKSKSF